MSRKARLGGFFIMYYCGLRFTALESIYIELWSMTVVKIKNCVGSESVVPSWLASFRSIYLKALEASIQGMRKEYDQYLQANAITGRRAWA
jgi:hypothetical protein